jgi:ABC-type Na+ transport system ATPase subunit NatA
MILHLSGKTTTMSMVVGMLEPTSGTVYVNGFDVRLQTKQARRSLGLCPQFDVLWSGERAIFLEAATHSALTTTTCVQI